MSKIYVFGIGGTGSRVMRALTMLLASGVKCNAEAIVPIIIDPDAAGGDVERTATLMRHYNDIRSNLNFSDNVENRFFSTEIKEIMRDFHLPLKNTEECRFYQYMDMNNMSDSNKALASILFSDKNLNSDMKVGFKGNPNVGSVVLNQFEDSPEFKSFANDFNQGDRIFIISSIFGGTGASGFPLLLKTLRESSEIPNQKQISEAQIGAITVLPYFKVKQDGKSQIDSATFISKAKSALSYYERTVNREISNLYYIGDDSCSSTYDNFEGGSYQKNNAHFLEMVSALAIIDFSNQSKPCKPKEFGIEDDVKEIIFKNLGNVTREQLQKVMTQFMLFAKYLDEKEIDDYMDQAWAKDRGMDRTFFCSDFFDKLKRHILLEYIDWMTEMASQDRAFTPFEIHKDSSRVFDLVKGVEQRRVFSVDSNFALFDNRLNGSSKKVKTGEKEQQFMELFYLATSELVKDKFKIE